MSQETGSVDSVDSVSTSGTDSRHRISPPPPDKELKLTFPDRKPDRYIMEWDTVGVTPLPAGWRNVYDDPDNPGNRIVTACPALLTQEHRTTALCWDSPNGDPRRFVSRTKHLEPPYEVRVVFADYDNGFGELGPAIEVSNYVGALSPDEPSPLPAGSTQNPRNTQNPDSVDSVDSVAAPATTERSA